MNSKVSMYLPEELLIKAMKVTGSKTKTGVVILGLKELLRKRTIKDLSKFRGSKALGLSQKDLQEMRKR